ncbi:TIR-like protein FxsC [Nonomuraea sp. NPDC003804]|uniref:TIR-like protein FxsC n=1 Tax=Nonomuraea sp. NPDC003804 TaxID=3154547 RepID=UPI0033B0A8CF
MPESPYFFLSYRRNDVSDLWVARFFKHLSDDVRAVVNVEQPGFMDRQVPIGGIWPSHVSQALSTCRVFVPVYSMSYFDSEHCGKEWGAFSRRCGPGSEAILPVLWAPLYDTPVPECAGVLNYGHAAFGKEYARSGIYGVMKLRRFREAYKEGVWWLARRIIEVGRTVQVPYQAIPDYREQPNAFATVETGRPYHVTVVAPSLSALPGDRDPGFYGRSPLDWNPFAGPGTLAEAAAEVVRRQGLRPVVGTLEEAGGLDGEQGVVLLDPWALADTGVREAVSRLTAPVLVPWPAGDTQSAAERERLEGALRETVQARPISDLDALADLIRQAEWRRLREAPGYPPPGPSSEKPRLSGPEEWS